MNITPPLGIKLIGSYGKPSDDVMDELYAKALVLGDGTNTIAIVSADLLYTPLEEITNPVREIIKDKIGIGPQSVLVCGTHTHSGPEVFTRSKLRPDQVVPASELDRSYLDTLVRKMAGAVLIAYRNMQDVRIGFAKGAIPEIVYNRRPKREDGSVEMAFTLPPEVAATRKTEVDPEGHVRVTFTMPPEKAQLEFGPIDPDVCVLRAEDVNGVIVGSLISFGCHPVSIYPHLSTTISADYPAHVTRVVEQAEGGIALFALGLAGNTVPIQRGPGPCRQIGRALGAEAVRRLQLVATTGDVTLKALRKEVTFPTKEAPPADDTTDEAAPEKIISEIQVLRIGDIYVLGLPGEVLVEVGLEIKKRAGLRNLFIVTVANDAIGYVCHSAAYDEGGYEPGSGAHLAKGAGEIMIEHALDLLNLIRSGE